MSDNKIALVFLARGYEDDYIDRFRRFIKSYQTYTTDQLHNLHIIYKGFRGADHEKTARDLFETIPHTAHVTDDLGFDIGSYSKVSQSLNEEFVCFLNSNAEILAEGWLCKLISNLDDPAVGMVSATGSFESLNFLYSDFPSFPNPHLRTNAFALRLQHVHKFFQNVTIRNKTEAWRFESGAAGLTRRFLSQGLACLVVGKDGCGYGQNSWSHSETYRQGLQSNLLVGDNVTRMYCRMNSKDRDTVIRRTWGRFITPKIITNDSRFC